MNVLIYTWNAEYMLNDVVSCLKELGHHLSFVAYPIMGKDKSNNQFLYNVIDEKLSSCKYDFVFSINYFPDIARVCNHHNTLYISWTYDCPLDIVNIEETLCLPCNRAFFFDSQEVNNFNSNGIDTAFHMPLAVNVKRLNNFSFSSKFSSDISFVGRVYHSSFPTLCKYLDEYHIGYLKGIIEAQKNTYGAYLAKDVLTDDFMKKINEIFKKYNCPYSNGDSIVTKAQLGYSLATEATFENRLLILGLLSKKHNLKWYTTPDSESLPGVNKCPPVSYYEEMPQVFKSSKINLHIGLHSIPSGISLRILDILGSGGFLLSSYQPELFDILSPGEDFDYYSFPEEAYDKANFYLNHEDLRKSIALSGLKKVAEYYSFENMLNQILDISFSRD